MARKRANPYIRTGYTTGVKKRRTSGSYSTSGSNMQLAAQRSLMLQRRRQGGISTVGRTGSEIKVVDCYFDSTPIYTGPGVAPNPVDVYSLVGGINVASNLWPAVGQGTQRNQRIGSKIGIKYIDVTGILWTTWQERGDMWRVSLCAVNKNGGNNGNTYGSQVYGSANNTSVQSTLGAYYWPRNEDYMKDFKVLKEWKLSTIATAEDDGTYPVVGTIAGYCEKLAKFKKHITFNPPLLMQWGAADTTGSADSTLETSFFLLFRNTGRDEWYESSKHRTMGSIRVGFTDI